MFDRWAVLWPNLQNLAVFQFGWPYNFWVGRLVLLALFTLAMFENNSTVYFKNEMSGAPLFSKSPVPCVRAACCRESKVVSLCALVIVAWSRPFRHAVCVLLCVQRDA